MNEALLRGSVRVTATMLDLHARYRESIGRYRPSGCRLKTSPRRAH